MDCSFAQKQLTTLSRGKGICGVFHAPQRGKRDEMQKAGLTAWKTASCPVTDEVMLQGRVRSSRYAPCIGQRRFVQRAHESASGGTTFCRVSKCARLTRLRGLSFYSGCGESSRIVDFSCQYANTPAYTMSIVSQKRRDSDGGGRCL